MILLFFTKRSQTVLSIASRIVQFFRERDISVVASHDYLDFIGVKQIARDQVDQVEYALTLGGDGTILEFARHYPYERIPLVGINMGYLGFMADLSVASLESHLLDLIHNRYQIEKRVTLQGRIGNEKTAAPFSAINDIVLHRGKYPSLIELSVEVDGHYVNTFRSDGLIIATPTGSTAYSLSSGGPILSPDIQAVVLTAINPHTLSNRPIVLSPQQELKVTVIEPRDPISVSHDGCFFSPLSHAESVHITLNQHAFQLIKFAPYNYFSLLREKLGWVEGKKGTQNLF